jgi:WD40 repeat protein
LKTTLTTTKAITKTTVATYDPKLKQTIIGHIVYVLTALPNGDLVTGLTDMTIKIWNPNDGTLKRTLNGHTGRVYSLTTLSNGDLVSGSFGQSIQIWNPNDGTLKRTFNGHTDRVYSLTTLPNGDLVSGSYDKTIKIWKTGS